MNNTHSVLIVIVVAAVTIALRFLPFLIFRENQKTPPFVAHLGQVLPNAIMGMLVVYCLKGISFRCAPFGIPEIISCLVVAVMHIWKRNTLLSIGLGTVCYMALIQTFF